MDEDTAPVYQLITHADAEHDVQRLPKDVRRRLDAGIQALARDPRPHAPRGKPLTGPLKGLWRLRVGDWRVQYAFDDENRVIRILSVLPRGEAYKDRA